MTKSIISFEATEELKKALRTRAFIQGVSVSSIIRDILEANVLVDEPTKLSKEVPLDDNTRSETINYSRIT